MYRAYFIILYSDQKMHTIISQIITLLHVSTLLCHPQKVCNQYLAKLQQVFQMQLLVIQFTINPLNAELNPICHLLALLGAHHILHVSRIRVKMFHTGFMPVPILQSLQSVIQTVYTASTQTDCMRIVATK